MRSVSTAPSSHITTAVVALDDPEYSLNILASGDFRQWRSQCRAKEPWTFDWLAWIPSTGVLYDVGACVGSYSLMAAARGVTVVALEPIPWNYGHCAANVCMNKLAHKVTVLPYAVGSHDGVTVLRHPAAPISGWGLATSDWTVPDDNAWQVLVPMVTMRSLTKKYAEPTHVKIDVEGAEVEVLRGMDFDGIESIICEIRDDEAEAKALVIVQAQGFETVWKGGRRTEQQRTHIWRRRA